jgi:hypothetical protein
MMSVVVLKCVQTNLEILNSVKILARLKHSSLFCSKLMGYSFYIKWAPLFFQKWNYFQQKNKKNLF